MNYFAYQMVVAWNIAVAHMLPPAFVLVLVQVESLVLAFAADLSGIDFGTRRLVSVVRRQAVLGRFYSKDFHKMVILFLLLLLCFSVELLACGESEVFEAAISY